MSEISETFKVMKKVGQEKRQSNYSNNLNQLNKRGVNYIEKPNGHFIILDKNDKPTHDFWASTGLIIERSTKRRSRGIRNLLKFIGK